MNASSVDEGSRHYLIRRQFSTDYCCGIWPYTAEARPSLVYSTTLGKHTGNRHPATCPATCGLRAEPARVHVPGGSVAAMILELIVTTA
jgi:hypothetical protein